MQEPGVCPRTLPPAPLRPRASVISCSSEPQTLLYCNWRKALKPTGLPGRGTTVIRDALNHARGSGDCLSGNNSPSAEPQCLFPALFMQTPGRGEETPLLQGCRAVARLQDSSGDGTPRHCHLAGGTPGTLLPVRPATWPHPSSGAHDSSQLALRTHTFLPTERVHDRLRPPAPREGK